MKTSELHDKIFNTVTSNGMREMTLFRFREAIGMLWTSPCDCNPDEKTGETLCCNICGNPTARTESKELPGEEQLKSRYGVAEGHIMGAQYMRSIASPLLASRDARLKELEANLNLAEIYITELKETIRILNQKIDSDYKGYKFKH